MDGVPYTNTIVSTIEDGKAIIVSLRPDWLLISHKEFDGGITNKLIGYKDDMDGLMENMVLLRMYGNNTDLLIDRKKELRNHVNLAKMGFATPVYMTVNNGYFYGYVDGDVLTTDSVRDPKIAPIIATTIARMHCKTETQHSDPVYYPKLNEWLRNVPDYFTAEKFTALLKVVKSKSVLSKELQQINRKLQSADLEVGFCHNDLLLGNVIYNVHKNSISFIDYEYGDPNYLAYDIGNHFAEYAGVDNVDFNLYPDEGYQRWWLRFYLEEKHKCKGLGAVTDEDVEKLFREVNFFSCCAHLLWGIWAIVQAINSEIDFDFAGYAAMKLEEYFKRKEQFFDLI
eukprot:sb/3466414/